MRRLVLIAGLAATTACGHSRLPAEVSPLAVSIDRRPDPVDPTMGLQEVIPTTTVLATTTTTLDQQRVSAPKSSRNAATTRPGPAPRAGGAAPLACIRSHESDTSGGYRAISASGKYRGAYQFDQRTWDGAVARAGHPEYAGTLADQAPPAVQDAAARQLYAERGLQPWPPAKGCA